MGRPPGLQFFWILMDLRTQLGAKLGGKIEPRQDKTRQEKTGQDRTRQDKYKARQDKTLKEKVPSGQRAGGRGGSPRSWGVTLHWIIPP